MPLVLPADGSFIETICGIDPGSNTLGLCFLKYHVQTFEIISITAETHRAERFIDEDCELARTHSVRLVKLLSHRDNLITCFEHERPSFICAESPFINRHRPEAVVALVETMSAIEVAAVAYDPLIPFIKYPPATVKKSIGAFATGTKTNVLDALLATQQITLLIKPEVLKLYDEHSIDAISVAYTHYKNLKKESANVHG